MSNSGVSWSGVGVGAGVLLFAACFCIIGLGGLSMLVIGSICMDGLNRGQDDVICGSRSSSLAILIVGIILSICCCCCGIFGIKFSFENRQTDDLELNVNGLQ